MIGRRLLHYEITGKLGEGGMGVVWRAHDTQLDRDVALKVLPAERFSDESARARLVREARVASRLNHPSICTIHEVGESDGQAYIAMELVEGRTLSARVAEGAVASEEVLRIGLQIAEAVAHAHKKGVVHRDLKSANVILTPEGRVKVLDFGLAKRVCAEAAEGAPTETMSSLTAPGVIVGTLAYMPPEQLRGQATDARSDVWSLGVVLYEMAAGRRPFQGQSGFDLSAAILNRRPPPLPSAVTGELGAVIARCLAKEPAGRYQQAGELRAALEAIGSGKLASWAGWRYALSRRRLLVYAGGASSLLGALAIALRVRLWGPPRAVRLAVLPFVNLSGNPQQEYFSDGMTEEMIAQLGSLHPASLSVIARTSVMRYKNSNTPIDQVGRELGVDYILEGSARREAGRVRITADLIQVKTQAQLWTQTFEREMAGILALQSEVAKRVAGSLALQLLPAEQTRLASARPVNPEAYEAWLKGMDAEDLDSKLEYFELALKKDPKYAPAYAGIASVWMTRQQLGYTAPREAVLKAKTAALKAVELDNTFAGGYARLAGINFLYEWDWVDAELEYKKAIELAPNALPPLYSHYLMVMKRPKEAMAHMQRTMQLDPFNRGPRHLYAYLLSMAGRYDDVIAYCREPLRRSPRNGPAHWLLGVSLYRKARYKESLEELKAYYDALGIPEFGEALMQGYAESGYSGALRRAASVLAERSRKTYVIPSDVAALYAMAGDQAQAIAWLEQGLEARDGNMPYVGVAPEFETLHNAPGFRAILRRMNLPE